MSIRSKAIAAIVSAAIITLVPVSSNAAVSCITVNKYYPAGVAASKYSKNLGGDLLGSPRVRASVYKKYAHLDIDKDKIVCEKEKVSEQRSASTTLPEGFLANINGSVPASYSISIEYSENVNEAFLSRIRSSLGRAIDATDEISLPSNVEVYLFTVKDSQWLSEKLSSVGASAYVPRGSAHEYLRNSRTEDCGQAFIVQLSGKKMFFQCTAYDGDGWDSSIHEYFHMVQMDWGLYGNGIAPLWLFEGSATYFKDLLDGNMSMYRRVPDDFNSVQEIVYRLKRLEATSDNGSIISSNHGYHYSYFVVRHLIDKYGYSSFIDFNSKVKSLGWRQAFDDSYEVDLETLYFEVASNVYNLYN